MISMLENYNWETNICEKKFTGPYVIIKGNIWKDAEKYFRNVWYCCTYGIDYTIDKIYSRDSNSVNVTLKVTVEDELHRLLKVFKGI